MPKMNTTGQWKGIFSALIVAVALYVFAGASTAQIGPTLEGCPVFPENNIWNTSVAELPLDPNSSSFINTIGPTRGLHPDFGAGTWNGGPIGIPYNVVDGSQTEVNISFEYTEESDPGPYPIPPNALIEGGSQSTGDRHVLVLDRDSCILYEIYSAYPQQNGTWLTGSGAVYDLNSNALRPAGWTSADAAGLADPPRTGALRRGGGRRDSACAALYGTSDPQRLCLAGPPRSLKSHWSTDPADGAALSPESRIRYLAVFSPGACHPAGHEDLRPDSG